MPSKKHTILIDEEDFSYIKILIPKYGIIRNVIHEIFEENIQLKKENTQLKKNIKKKDHLIEVGFMNITSNVINNTQRVQVNITPNLTPPPPPPTQRSIQSSTTPHVLPAPTTGLISSQYGMIREMQERFGVMCEEGNLHLEREENIRPSLVVNAIRN